VEEAAHAGAVPSRPAAWHRAALLKPLNREKRPGFFKCVCCGAWLFASGTKFASGTGWPSFWEPVDNGAVREHEERSWLMRRTEIRCASCDAHLGHVFPDGPKPTGARCCMNGVALSFAPNELQKGDCDAAGDAAADKRSPVGVAAYELLSMCVRNSAIEPNRTVPLGSSASIDPSA
jgi:peptide-methionine (R)-S-oxide reductase